MEHILQFAIGIDEDRIKEEIKQSAVNKVSKELADAAKKRLGQDYYGRFPTNANSIKWQKQQLKML